MMVLREISVECFAKIAMTALPGTGEAMRLLQKHRPPRRIFVGSRAV